MRLTPEEVEHVALLARLRLTDEEIQTYTEQLSAILEYAERIQEVDTSSVPPTRARSFRLIVHRNRVTASLPPARPVRRPGGLLRRRRAWSG